MTDRKRALDVLQKVTYNKFAPSVEDQISAMLVFADECVKEAVQAEREACAKACRDMKVKANPDYAPNRYFNIACNTCAKAILERGK